MLMKKLFLLMAVAITAMSLCAAPVDQAVATKVAKKYLAEEMYAGKIMASSALTPVLLKTEYADKNMDKPVYYIYNTSTTFLVIAGDDRAEAILMVGDHPLKDINHLAPAMQEILNMYKEEIHFLHENPNLKVERLSDKLHKQQLRAVTYGPLLTAEWDQEAPYNNLCKFTYNNRTYTCLTGCPATSAAMVFYFWKYPTAQIPAMSSYTSTLDIGSYTSNEVTYTYPALDATTFDWANMKDKYNSYTTAQATAVATLMRYIGQAEQMMYGVSGSGIYTNQTQKVVNMFKNWGYASTCAVKYKSSYSATNWANLIIDEMAAGRPVIYNGVDNSAGGHAFNVDGYRDSDSKYHVNFGWSGDGNGWYAMNSFTYSGYTFSQDQQAVIGIQPPGNLPPAPELTVEPTSLTFTGNTGQTYTQTFTVTGANLQGDVTLALSGTGASVYSVSPTTLTAAQAEAGATVTVTYSPVIAGTKSATVTVSSTNATNKTVSLSGSASTVPTLNVDPASLSMTTSVGTPVTATFNLSGSNLTNNVELTVEGTDKYEFSVDKAAILKSAVANGVTVTVTYDPAEQGTHSAYVLISSSGAEDVTVSLTGTATEPERTITLTPTSLSFETVVGQSVTKTFNLKGANLNSNVTLSVSGGSGFYSLSNTSVTASRANNGLNITVTYNPTAAGTHNATVTVSGGGATSKTVSLTGTAAGPTITANPTSLTFAANTGETVTNTFTVTGSNLSGNLTLALNDANGVYSITPTTITAANAANGVPVTVTYAPTAYGTHNATVTISGAGASDVTVNLNGTATLAKFTPVMLAAVEDYINLTKFRADWTDATPAGNVASYTLEVSTKVEEPAEPVLLHSLSGSSYTGNYNDITLPAPWGGVSVRGGNNAIYIKNNYNNVAQGYISYTIPEGYTNATFTVMITSANSNYGTGNVTVYSPQTAEVGYNFSKNQTYKWLVTASSGEQIIIYSTDNSYSPDMSLIAVYSGDATGSKLMANESGDATYRLITGITDKFYTVENLTAEGTFLYKVKAIYLDGTESDWSNIEEVTLFQNGHGYELGDVNHDGAVNIVDVTDLIDYVLDKTLPICTICADFDQSGEINIVDVTELIDFVLGGSSASLNAPKPILYLDR